MHRFEFSVCVLDSRLCHRSESSVSVSNSESEVNTDNSNYRCTAETEIRTWTCALKWIIIVSALPTAEEEATSAYSYSSNWNTLTHTLQVTHGNLIHLLRQTIPAQMARLLSYNQTLAFQTFTPFLLLCQ